MIGSIVIVITSILWPLNLYLANTYSNFIQYIIPAFLLLISYFLYKKNTEWYLAPIFAIGLFEPKLALFPLFFILLSNKKLIYIVLSFFIIGIQFSGLKGQMVFNRDYESEQKVLRNIQLYPNIFTARLFQNKPKIYLNKISANLFAITDPNNYFFGFHPRQITIDNQNLYKFPFIAVIFLLYGIYYLGINNERKFILASILGAFLSLTPLTNFDRNDFSLWTPLVLLIIHGTRAMEEKNNKIFIFISTLLIIFATAELLKSLFK